MLSKRFLCALALGAITVATPLPLVAQAQIQASAPVPSPAQRSAATPLGPSDFVNAAMQLVSAIDRFDIASVWDKASPIMQARVPKAQFVADTAQQRARLGTVQTRDWLSVGRTLVSKAGGSLPVGQYLTVRLNSVGQNGRMDEILSFHLDDDRQWRLAGYALVTPGA